LPPSSLPKVLLPPALKLNHCYPQPISSFSLPIFSVSLHRVSSSYARVPI